MKNKLLVLGFGFLLLACNNGPKRIEATLAQEPTSDYTSIGEAITADAAKSTTEMAEIYNAMSKGDTLNTKMMGTVGAVCQNKGCWMKINLEDGEQIMVKFKDYGFFVPKDIAGQEVVLDGKAFIDEVSIEELRHYAEDGGKSIEEIAAITEPKTTLSFEASGVLLKM